MILASWAMNKKRCQQNVYVLKKYKRIASFPIVLQQPRVTVTVDGRSGNFRKK